MQKTLIQCIAMVVGRDLASGDQSMEFNNLRQLLPSGAGLDSGTSIDATSTIDRIVLNTSFHHMNDAGYYDGWTDHKIIIKPEFDGLQISIGGRNRNQIKEYLHETFCHALAQLIDVQWDNESKHFSFTFAK